eukprot:TRINITY_DN48492_c0_g1_i1.p1 TRINITY_DN48492_c0_g1~~TRINITY_DN48492_c0_g1_i1.p1  ORF type:complete len:523 (-),score=82.74 TRINITY_DN48492_c0_g1_i1:115-1557(-)
MRAFGAMICGDPMQHKELVNSCSPFEIAVLGRAWRMDFGAPSAQQEQRPVATSRESHLQERRRYVGGHDHMYLLDGYTPAGDAGQQDDANGIDVRKHGPRVAWGEASEANGDRPVQQAATGQPLQREDDQEASERDLGAGIRRPAEVASRRYQQEEEVDLSGATAIAASPDGLAVFVAGRRGLMRFDLPELRLAAVVSYSGPANPEGYADLSAGDGFVVCADVDGNLYRHDAETCELQIKRAYQPSVMENSQRIVASQLQRFSAAIVGLEGGFGGASRLAVGQGAVYLGGRDGVVTSYAAGSLNLTARSRLQEGPASTPIGVRSLFLSPRSQRLYCCVLSSVHVLATPAMQEVARLRGGPRVPVFGCVGAAIEEHDGKFVFVADVGGPSIHVWDTSTWQWVARVELAAGGGPACQLAVAPSDTVLYAATECNRFMAFDYSRRSPLCIEEGAGGGPMVVLPPPTDQLVVLTNGRLRMRSHS